MSALRTLARWSAGPAFGITLGLALGMLADHLPRPRMTMLVPPAMQLTTQHLHAPSLRPPAWTVLAAASD
ncbi:hypothetical protein [Acidisoma sp. 7E03]